MEFPNFTVRETLWRHGATCINGRECRILQIHVIYPFPISVSVTAGIGKEGSGIIASCNIVKAAGDRIVKAAGEKIVKAAGDRKVGHAL